MRLTQKKIEEIILTILGETGLPLIKQLYGKENVSEFDLASRTKLDIKVIRRMLYFLYNNNLISFIRKKDKEKGWYIYYWTLVPENIRFIYLKKKTQLLERLNQRLDEEHKELFFVCPGKCVRLNFDQAMDFDFHCPECGELLSQDSNEKRIKELKEKIGEIEKELEKAKEARRKQREASKERKTVVKAKVKTKKAVKKKVAKKKTTKKKTSKKTVKKVVKKKTVKKKSVKNKIAKVKKVKKKIAKKRKAVKKVVKSKSPKIKVVKKKSISKKKPIKKIIKKKKK
jgi:transcription initiation factor TFIIE subunit alpha